MNATTEHVRQRSALAAARARLFASAAHAFGRQALSADQLVLVRRMLKAGRSRRCAPASMARAARDCLRLARDIERRVTALPQRGEIQTMAPRHPSSPRTLTLCRGNIMSEPQEASLYEERKRNPAKFARGIEQLQDAVGEYLEQVSMRQAAREIGMSPMGLTKFVHGATPHMHTLRKLRAWHEARTAGHSPPPEGASDPDAPPAG